ncbi:ribonuclease VapC [Gemmatimonadetes bacterium T265]|nr:ribonuclease VapC [Gemmatimonadetes bacterium T265]
MNWVLDTNVLIHLARRHPTSVVARYTAVPVERLAVSSVSVAELWYGAAGDARPEARRAKLDHLLAPLRVPDLDRRAAEIAGQLRYTLRHAPVGQNDVYIAATALAHGCGVVTANVREFSRVPGPAVEDWTAA